MENFIEIFMLIIALLTPFVWFTCPSKDEHPTDGKFYLVARNIVAIGICVAWLEFIFIVGRLPLKGGNFSIMFYNVSKTVFAYFGALACLDIGFGLGFMITHQCADINPFLSYYSF